jgi:hypothetical protein
MYRVLRLIFPGIYFMKHLKLFDFTELEEFIKITEIRI